jgi:hypothetical protein
LFENPSSTSTALLTSTFIITNKYWNYQNQFSKRGNCTERTPTFLSCDWYWRLLNIKVARTLRGSVGLYVTTHNQKRIYVVLQNTRLQV